MVPGIVEVGTIFYIHGDLEGKPLPAPQPIMVLAPATLDQFRSYWTDNIGITPEVSNGKYWRVSTD